MGGKFNKVDKMKIAFVFPGQASQYVGMGKEIIEEQPQLLDILKTGEKVTNSPLIEKIFNGPMEDLTRTLYCQPSIFGISLICWKYFSEKTKITPDCVAGHSLGEYTALCVSNVFSIEEGFYIVKKRAEAMDKISERVNGTLLAIIGINLSEVEKIIEKYEVEISNINSYTQIIVGGKKEEIEKLSSELKEKRIKNIPLKVSGPFHTRFMKPAAEILKQEIEKIEFKDASIPVYMNFSGEKTVDKEEIKEGLIKQLFSPVKWVEIIENMVNDGVEIFIELGPKNVLKKLIDTIIPSSFSFNIENKETLETFLSWFKMEGENV